VAAIGVGCGGSAGPPGASGPPGSSVPGNDRIAGHWQYVSGPLIAGATIDRISYLDLAVEGSGALFTRSASNGINGCGSVVFAVLSDTIVAASLPDFPAQNSVATQFYRYALPSSNMLTLTDAFGNATTFQRATAIPSSVMCPPVPSATPIAIQDNQPSDRSGLASDGTTLWYSPNSGGARALNPLTGATGPSVSFGTGQFQWMQAIQGSDFWITCGCGKRQLHAAPDRDRHVGQQLRSLGHTDQPARRYPRGELRWLEPLG
jgi:hypothetical protein